MNKIIYIFLIAFGAILASCEPETIEGSTAQAFSGELDATCELEIINGKAANMAILNCKSPVTCQWTDGISKLASNSGKIQLMGTGNQKITLTAMDQTGEIVTKEFTVNVQELAYPVPEIYGLLFDGSEKSGNGPMVHVLVMVAFMMEQQGLNGGLWVQMVLKDNLPVKATVPL